MPLRPFWHAWANPLWQTRNARAGIALWYRLANATHHQHFAIVTPARQKALIAALTLTDSLFLLYWAVTLIAALGVITPPAAILYANYHDPRVIAWNWSFLPVDLAFSGTGLTAAAAWRRGAKHWPIAALISLILTMVAGGMAVSYWAILGEYNPAWFLPNLALLIWPLAFLPALIKKLANG